MSFEAFQSRRTRFFDRMAADALLHTIETGSDHSHRRANELGIVEEQVVDNPHLAWPIQGADGSFATDQ